MREVVACNWFGNGFVSSDGAALAIAIFYAFGTAVGGIAGPAVFGALIETGARGEILWGYLLGGGLMVTAAIVALFLGVAAERRPLEEIAVPLSCLPEDTGAR